MSATTGEVKHYGPRVLPHPLEQLSIAESNSARKSLLDARGAGVAIKFRAILLQEPPKRELSRFLDLENSNQITISTPRPPRLAKVQYDVVWAGKNVEYMESLIDVTSGKEVHHRIVEKKYQAGLTTHEFREFAEACLASPLYKEAIAEFELPKDFLVTFDPWPYGGPDFEENAPRYIQGLCFAWDTRSVSQVMHSLHSRIEHGNKDSNHYAFPIPIIPVMDVNSKEIIRVDRLATGGKDDGLAYGTHKKNVLNHCSSAEYVPELLSQPLRTDVNPLNVIQPEGPSFRIDGNLVRWQKWRFRVGFNPREGATLHDVRYDGRSVLYRLSLSEMTVPYALRSLEAVSGAALLMKNTSQELSSSAPGASSLKSTESYINLVVGDPRPPFHRKQAFDFGDAGAGRAANNLALGCDCLGSIKYFDAVLTESDGSASVSKNVVCVHEQDNGIGWKHTNYRTDRAVVTRLRVLVIQFIITLANYEYVFAYQLDQAGGITIETRATGIVSVVNIDPGKASPWGNVVSPGALAQNHQHLFCIRIDPAIDGHSNTVVTEETLPLPMSRELNPYGNGYQVKQRSIKKSQFFDASPLTNLTVKITNPSQINPISGNPVAYKFTPTPSQLLLAHPNSIMAKRAQFAQHHVWVTKYRDGELWAGGEFTNQSKREIDGVADAVARYENVENEDIVVWNVFGLQHLPRVEDWPVMPVEIHQVHLRPADFFNANPAIDVPSSKNSSSVLTSGSNDCCEGGIVQQDPASHLQGTGPDFDPKSKSKL